ncbi:MAG: helix-turn-helix domain-containing protein [Blastocatellia bacterium]|nr:helix-turn-helix domain-containing protein [Blastocatellia bacterium]
MTTMLQTQEEVFDDGYLRVEYSHFYVACRGVPIYAISRKEFLILACLLRAKGRPVPHQEVWRYGWGDTEEFKDQVLRVHITNLRRKLTPYGIEIASMIGVGYYVQILPDSRKQESVESAR